MSDKTILVERMQVSAAGDTTRLASMTRNEPK
jgi:hypothetical protein